jgi:membrane-bound serine protease (ClpP class)
VLLVLAIVLAVVWLPSPWGLIAVAAAAAFEIAEIGVWVWYSKRRRPVSGVESLPGRVATVVRGGSPVGEVRLEGELWRARSEAPLAAGEQVVVERVEPGLTLLVKPFPRDG